MTHVVSSSAVILRAIPAAIAFGILGFVTGYFGPLYLLPDAGVGPLTSLFTAPVGFAVGAAAAAHAISTGLHGLRFARRLLIVAAAFTGAVLALVLVQ